MMFFNPFTVADEYIALEVDNMHNCHIGGTFLFVFFRAFDMHTQSKSSPL